MRGHVPSQQPVPCVNAHFYCRCTYKMCTCIYYAHHSQPHDPFQQARREAEGITRVLTMLPSRLPCPRRWCSRPRLSRAYTCRNAFRMRMPPPSFCPSRAPRPQGLPGTRPGAAWGPAARRPECSPHCCSVPCQTHPAFCQPHRHSERHASGTDALGTGSRRTLARINERQQITSRRCRCIRPAAACGTPPLSFWRRPCECNVQPPRRRR